MGTLSRALLIAGALLITLALGLSHHPSTRVVQADQGACPDMTLSEADPLFIRDHGRLCRAGRHSPHRPFDTDGTYGSGCFVMHGVQTAAVSVREPRIAGCHGTEVKYNIDAPSQPIAPRVP